MATRAGSTPKSPAWSSSQRVAVIASATCAGKAATDDGRYSMMAIT
jgi:hypothetical protein